jgi:hypothetical protein
LASFSQWIHLEAKDHDLEFVQTVLYFATQILNRSPAATSTDGTRSCVRGRKSALSTGHGFSTAVRPSTSGDNSFHVHPKKITEVSKPERAFSKSKNIKARALWWGIHQCYAII